MEVKNSASVVKADFGIPPATTGYALCDYSAGSLAVSAQVPDASASDAGCWTETDSGSRYVNDESTFDGIIAATLTAGAATKAAISVNGKGAGLGLPVSALSLPAIVQLSRNDSTRCWQAVYSNASMNGGERFVATSE